MPVSEGTLQWTAVGDHDVWRVRHPSGRTAIVKRTPDPRAATAILIRLAGSATAPTLLAADDRHGIVVLEDVGATTLTSVLTFDDASAATAALVELARTLGRLHRWTRDPTPARNPSSAGLPVAAFLNICGALDVPVDRIVRAELAEAERLLATQTPRVLLHGDLCPDNFVLGENGGRFVDFDCAQVGCAQLDAACWHLPFPTCWQVSRLPADLPAKLDEEYRGAFGDQQDAPYDASLAAAACFHLVSCIAGKRCIEATDQPLASGMATVRQRTLMWLDNVASVLARTTAFGNVGGVASNLAAALRRRWPDTVPAPYYPAFRSQRDRRREGR